MLAGMSALTLGPWACGTTPRDVGASTDRSSGGSAADAATASPDATASMDAAADAGATAVPDADAGITTSADADVDAGPATVADASSADASSGDASSADASSGDASSAADAGPSAVVPGLAAGRGSTCIILDTGTLKCWGSNASGRLGLGDTTSRGDQPNEMGANLPVVDLGTGRAARSVAIGNGHACAILDDGGVKCWGLNSDGQLGLGDRVTRGDGPGEMGDALPYVDLGVGRTARSLAAGTHHTCAILDTGGVKCWGQNISGALGHTGSAVPPGGALQYVDLGTGRTAKALAAGEASTCAILDDDRLKCWGNNTYGQAGLGDRNSRGDNPNEMGDNLPAVDLGPGRYARAVASHTYHTCALLDDGSVKCWGYNHGELGVGESTNDRGDQPNEMGANLPVIELGPGRTATAIDVGEQHSCALLDDGSVKCWGGNGYGELGLGDTRWRGDEPGELGANLPVVDLGPGAVVVQLVAGAAYNCVRLASSDVKCWGVNGGGQLGLGDTNARGDAPGEMGASLPALLLR
jgi:alpha-tubulin suppressor-like RCC1 family protein